MRWGFLLLFSIPAQALLDAIPTVDTCLLIIGDSNARGQSVFNPTVVTSLYPNPSGLQSRIRLYDSQTGYQPYTVGANFFPFAAGFGPEVSAAFQRVHHHPGSMMYVAKFGVDGLAQATLTSLYPLPHIGGNFVNAVQSAPTRCRPVAVINTGAIDSMDPADTTAYQQNLEAMLAQLRQDIPGIQFVIVRIASIVISRLLAQASPLAPRLAIIRGMQERVALQNGDAIQLDTDFATMVSVTNHHYTVSDYILIGDLLEQYIR